MKIVRNNYYLNNHGEIVKVLTNTISPFKIYMVLRNPEEPSIKNVYIVNEDGASNNHEILDDLIQDITCPQCHGRPAHIYYGPDNFECCDCESCDSLGFLLSLA